MAVKIVGILCAIALAVSGGIFGARWVELRYAAEREVLSFPERVAAQARRRGGILAGAYGLLFCWSILTSGFAAHFTGEASPMPGLSLFAGGTGSALQDFACLVFLLAFVFFLVLYTVTDFEQQVIFDQQILPFAVLGLRGAVGGGDIKLVGALGLWLGSNQLLMVVLFGTILGGVAALVLLATKRRKRGEMFAYGPYFTIVALALALL